jgi:monoamine oxidase
MVSVEDSSERAVHNDRRSHRRRSVHADVLVLGAGTAGVTAARALAQGGTDVVVLEAGSRVGGRVQTIRDFADAPIEAGAEFVHGSAAATWADVRASGLRTRAVPYRYTWANLGGRTRWLPIVLANPGVWPMFDILWSLRRWRSADVSAASFIETKRYRGTARIMAELALTGHLPGTTEDVGVMGIISDGFMNLEGGVNHRVLDGYDLLPAHIATGLDVRFGRRITEVKWGPDGTEATCDTGETFTARAGITTLPHGVLASGAVHFDPPLPPAKSAAIASIVTGPVAKVILRFEDSFWSHHMSQLVCGVGPFTLYWPTSFGVDGPPVLIAYATGPRARRLSEEGAEAAYGLALDDLDRLYPRVHPHRLIRGARFIDWLSDPNARGGYTYLRPGAVGSRQALADADTGSLLWAGSATSWVPIADTVEAAYLSGLRAARQVSRLLV